MAEFVLASSILLQAAAAVLALRLIRTTRGVFAWSFIAVAITLMTVRRIISFGKLLSGQREADLSAELVALTISICMLIGVALVNRVFAKAKAAIEAEKAREARALTHRLRSLEDLAGGIAHDFNNLLQIAQGHVEMIRLQPDLNSELSWKEIDTALRKAAEISSKMLSFSGRRVLTLRSTRVDLMIEKAVEDYRDGLPSGIELRFEREGQGPDFVRGDEDRLREIIINLLDNAVESSPANGAVITLRLRTAHCTSETLTPLHLGSGLPEGDYLVIEVQDQGSGIDTDDLSRVFEPFYSTRSVGRGLGLSVVQGILRTHGGAAHIETQPQRGTRIDIYLPLQSAHPSEVELVKS